MTESLLDKWAVNKGSLLSSSSGPLKSDLLSSSGQVRKRKTDVGLTTKPAEWKKIKETERPDLSLKSSLFSSNTKSSLLDSYGQSSLFTDSTLAESTKAKQKASEPLHTSRESTRPTLISMSRTKTELGGGTQFKSLTTGSNLLSSGLLSSSSLGGTSVFSKKPESSGTSLLGTSLSGSLLTSGTTSRLESSLSMAQPSSSLGQSSSLQGQPSSSLGQFSVHLGQASTSLGHSSLFKDQPINTGSTLMSGNYSMVSSGLSTGTTTLMKNSVNSSLGTKQSEGASQTGTSKKQKNVTADTKKGKKRTRSDRYSAPPPEYHLTNEIEETAEVVLPKFIPPEKDLLLTGVRLNDVNGLKFALVNAVSGSLICQPNFSLSTDNTRVTLVTMANKVICYDPEFILKLALYTRKELNIRTTGNFLLALASHIPACRPYLKKYYSASIGLPSDWIEVAEIYQAFPDKTLDLGSLPSALRRAMVAKFPDFDKYQLDKTLDLGSLPSALRRAMVAKFPDFDKYQLAKYNKDSSKKKKNKKAKKDEGVGAVRGRGRGRGRGQVVGRGRGQVVGHGRGIVPRGRGVVPRGRGGGFRGHGGRGRGGAMDVDSSSSDDSAKYNKDSSKKKKNKKAKKDEGVGAVRGRGRGRGRGQVVGRGRGQVVVRGRGVVPRGRGGAFRGRGGRGRGGAMDVDSSSSDYSDDSLDEKEEVKPFDVLKEKGFENVVENEEIASKYNKDSSKKKKNKKAKTNEGVGAVRGRGRGRGRGQVVVRGRGVVPRGMGVVPRGRGGAFTGRGGRGRGGAMDVDSSSSDDSDDSGDEMEKARVFREKGLHKVSFGEDESPEQLAKMTFTLKQLIRKLHIREPVEHVMCLLGKKYPLDLEEFYRSRLPGTFEEERAGKRMKLPVPETWETQVSLKGNKASTWQDLIDHKKLPFMAMLRNLRNLIKAGISNKHHNWVIHKLTDERSVIFSKQFPFRFFSAYEVLNELEKDYHKTQEALVKDAMDAENAKAAVGRGQPAPREKKVKLTSENWWVEKRKRKMEQKKKTQETPFDTKLINRYRKALDTAVKIATVYNVQPIRGRTIILCDVGQNMAVPCTAARGLGKPKTMQEVSVLLGLMCKYSCEDCVMVIFDRFCSKYCTVELNKGTILENMAVVLEKQMVEHNLEIRPGESTCVKCIYMCVKFDAFRIARKWCFHSQFVNLKVPGVFNFKDGLPVQVLQEFIRDRVQIDNLVVLSGGDQMLSQRSTLAEYTGLYRQLVNENLLYVNVSFAGNSCGFDTSIKPEHDNNIYISGFSDQILRFIAERGEGGQLRHIEMIDEKFNLKSLPTVQNEAKPAAPKVTAPPRALPITQQAPCWRSARVFISSTFKDMHGERDLLTRFVFPELRALGKKRFINVYEVDLRWGVTEEDTRSNKTLELCLTEISRCRFFLGLLGERYGWVPDKYIIPDTPEFDWVRNYPAGASVTELEMYCAALSNNQQMRDRAFFYFRDPAFEKDIPKSFKPDFLSENPANKQKMDNLKARIRKSGLEVFDGYPCNWGGVVDGKPIVGGLDEFGMRTLNNLWNAILKEYPDQDAVLDENSHATKLHEAFVESKKAQFVGRKKLVKESLKVLSDMKSGLICLSGKPGTGKTALLASILTEYVESKACSSGISVLSHFVGAAVGSQHIVPTLRRLCYELNCRFSLQMEVPEDYKNLVSKFEEMLKECAMLTESTLCLFMDGLDHMDSAYLPHNLDWIPATLPNNVVFVITCLTEKKVHLAMKRCSMTEIIVEGLDMWDKTEVVRNNLSTHRKSLDESPFNNQMKLLVSKKEANVPLYLSLACEELRVFGLFEKISSKLKSLPQTVSLLLQDVLGRIESDLGKNIVSTALSLLVCTRDGLEAGELHDILSLFGILEGSRPQLGEIVNIKLSPDQKLPSSTFSQLQRALQGFLYPTQAQSERLSLAHQDIENAVRQRYLKGSAAIETESFLHRLLAGYFYSQADPDRDGSWSGKSARAFCELPYHIVKSGCFSVLEEAICNLHFVHSKCILGMALQLLEDYQPKEVNSKTLEREQSKFFDKTTVKEYKSFVSRNLHILSSYPALTWQQAYNESQSSRPAVDVRQIMKNPGNHGNQASLMEWSSKPQTADPCYLTLSNLPQPMTSVSVSPNNEIFTCGGLDCMVHLYDLATGKELKTFRGHADMITDVCFAGSDKICSASLDNTVSVWNVEGGHRLFTLKGHQRRVNSCAADSTGNVVVTGSWDCTIKFWNVTKGKEMGDFKVGSPVNCVAFHPEGQLIVSGQWDSTIKIWDIFHKTKKAVLRGHKSSVRDVAYSPSGRHIASAAMDGDVKLWAAFTGSQVGNIQGHALPINKLIFSPSGKELITVSDDHKIKVWSGHLGKPINVLKDTDSDQNAAKSVAIAPDMETVAVGYHSGKISVFDIASGSRLYSMNSHTASIQCLKYVSADYIMSGSDDNKAIVHHSSNLRTACTLTAHTKPILCVDSCTDYIATTSEDCTVMLYENPLKYNVKIQQGNITLLVTLNAHTGPVTSCTFSKDGSKIATASRDMSVIIWDIVDICLNSDDPRPLLTLSDCHADWVTDCKFSNIGDFLVTSSNDFNLKIWDTSGKERFKMTGHMGAINHVGYSYGCIVSTCADGSVKMWTHKGVEITTLYGHTQRSTGCDIAVSVTAEATANKDPSDWATDDTGDKGKILQPKLENVIVATCGDEGDVRLWYPLQANELANLTGHSDKVIAVAANSKGHICSTSLDKSIKVWSCDLESKPLIGYHDAPVTFVSTFKNAILTGSRDGVLKVWSVEAESEGTQSYSGVVTLKVHERAVTCGCWLNSDTVITGGDDGCLRVTKLVKLNGKIVGLKKQTVLQVGSPVLSVTTNWNENQPIIITTDWSGHIKFWKNGKLVKQEQTAYSGCAWLLQAHLSGNNEILITTNDSYVLRCTFKEDAKEKLSARVYPPMLIPNKSLHEVSTDKVQNNWVLAIDGGSDDFITGDSHGQVSIMQNNTRVSKKVHAEAVTSVIRHQDYIFTASEDKTIKVWNLDLVQVGQFFTQSPVTNMRILHSGDRAAIPLVFGDELGFVHFITWKTGL